MNYFDDLNVTYVGNHKSRINGSSLGPHEFYGVGFMLGDGYLRRKTTEYDITLKMPFVYLIHPSKCCGAWMTVDGAQRDNRWFVVSGPRAERLTTCLMKYSETVADTFPLKNYSELMLIHQKMFQLFNTVQPSRNYRLTAYVEEFIAALYDALYLADLHSPIHELIGKVIQLISDAPGGDLDFESLAKEYKISYYHLRRRFVEITGVPLHEFVLQKRFTMAVAKLKSGTESIKEIADSCGFFNTSDFSRFIKRRSGLTPSELKKQPQYLEV